MNENVKDYVLLMLGAPVVKVELDDKQLDECIEYAHYKVNEIKKRFDVDLCFDSIIKDGALAKAMMVLGVVRSKYDKIPSCGGEPIKLDGKQMHKEGVKSLDRWEKEIHSCIFAHLSAKLHKIKQYMNARW